MFARPLLLLPLAVLAHAQLTPNSVTVTANRTSTLQPDQALIRLTLRTNVDATRDEALAALQPLGITLANFSGVSTVQSYDNVSRDYLTSLGWMFSYPVDLSNMKTAVANINAAQQAITQRKNGMALDFSIAGTQVSARLAQTQPCPLADLLSDARAQAVKLASAAGMSVGAVLAMSGPSTGSGVSSGLAYAVQLTDATPVCSMTVKFALGGF